MLIKISELESLIIQALRTKYSEDQSVLIKEVVMFGELSGKPSHGILRLLKENFGVFVEKQPDDVTYDRRTKVSTVIDAKGNPGMLVGPLAMVEVINLAKEHDIGIVGTKGSINTTGALSYYVNKIAKDGLIGIVFTQSSPMMSAFGSKKAIFGTNPLAFGFPAPSYPLLFDMSTSAITFGAVAKMKAEGKSLPPNVAIDDEGNVTTDPAKAIDGATLPFEDSYKGSALAMMVEILGSLWPGAGFAGTNIEDGWGNLYMAFSPNLLADSEQFKQKINMLRETIRHMETSNGKEVRIPGENTQKIYEESIKRGAIEVNENTIKRIKELIKN